MTWSRLIPGFACWAAIRSVRTMERVDAVNKLLPENRRFGTLWWHTLARASDLKTNTVTYSQAATLGSGIQAFGYLRGGPDRGGCRYSFTILMSDLARGLVLPLFLSLPVRLAER
jgi:hypothetical protein